jgi:hypothetical protein
VEWRALTVSAGSGSLNENDVRAALNCQWAASGAIEVDGEHDKYRDDVVVEYPQSSEHIGGRENVLASRAAQPISKRCTVWRIVGTGDLWATEFIITYHGEPSYPVSVLKFLDGAVARETQYTGEPFEPGPSRPQLVERIA